MDRGGVHQVRAAMLPCSTSPAVVPAAAATAAAAAVTEAGAVVCLLPTVKESDAQTHKEKESYGGRGGWVKEWWVSNGGGERGVKMRKKSWSDILKET